MRWDATLNAVFRIYFLKFDIEFFMVEKYNFMVIALKIKTICYKISIEMYNKQ